MHRIFLFGEAEKGELCIPYICKNLAHLLETVGNPPMSSQGILYAVQALLFQRELIFFRVKEEGFSLEDYKRGIKLLRNKELNVPIDAICMPGMGDAEIIDAMSVICKLYKSFLIFNESDLYDYLSC